MASSRIFPFMGGSPRWPAENRGFSDGLKGFLVYHAEKKGKIPFMV